MDKNKSSYSSYLPNLCALVSLKLSVIGNIMLLFTVTLPLPFLFLSLSAPPLAVPRYTRTSCKAEPIRDEVKY